MQAAVAFGGFGFGRLGLVQGAEAVSRGVGRSRLAVGGAPGHAGLLTFKVVLVGMVVGGHIHGGIEELVHDQVDHDGRVGMSRNLNGIGGGGIGIALSRGVDLADSVGHGGHLSGIGTGGIRREAEGAGARDVIDRCAGNGRGAVLLVDVARHIGNRIHVDGNGIGVARFALRIHGLHHVGIGGVRLIALQGWQDHGGFRCGANLGVGVGVAARSRVHLVGRLGAVEGRCGPAEAH